MKINMLRYIFVLVPEVPGGGGGSKSVVGLWPMCYFLPFFPNYSQVTIVVSLDLINHFHS